MCNCSCGSEEKKNALLPQVGIITDIRRETPDVKNIPYRSSGRHQAV